jgi:hypothetical protein
MHGRAIPFFGVAKLAQVCDKLLSTQHIWDSAYFIAVSGTVKIRKIINTGRIKNTVYYQDETNNTIQL